MAFSHHLLAPEAAKVCYVMAHGAGAGMSHPFMVAVADGLFDRGIATFRYEFGYMERGAKRPDVPAVAHRRVREAVAAAASLLPGMPLFAGGKSFGGRMTSQAQAGESLAGVRGLVFFGFPLHPAKKPSDARAQHLQAIDIPMLFLQGTNDALAEMHLLGPTIERLGAMATLTLLPDADHSFRVPARSGRTAAQVLAAALDAMADWIANVENAV